MLTVLPYHLKTAQHFRQQTRVWDFFSSHTHKEEQLQQFKTDLLRNTYKFSAESEPALYEKVKLAKEKLGITLPVTLYQAQHTDEMNAGIVYLPAEIHIVFSGKIMQVMNDEEQLAIIAHELSHAQLYSRLNGDVEVADRIVTAIGNHAGSSHAHYETARLFKLYTEIFCDRGAYTVTGTYAPIISSLVKAATGLQSVNADNYLKQAEEIFKADITTKTLGISHPENFIRARAIWLWHTQREAAENEIVKMIEGHTNLNELDLFQQEHLTAITRELVLLLMSPKWMRTPLCLALAKQYFDNFDPAIRVDRAALASRIATLHESLLDYLAYVCYDFATADKDLEDVPLGLCFSLTDELNIDKSFANTLKRERRLTEKKISFLKKQSLGEYQRQDLQTI